MTKLLCRHKLMLFISTVILCLSLTPIIVSARLLMSSSDRIIVQTQSILSSQAQLYFQQIARQQADTVRQELAQIEGAAQFAADVLGREASLTDDSIETSLKGFKECRGLLSKRLFRR